MLKLDSYLLNRAKSFGELAKLKSENRIPIKGP